MFWTSTTGGGGQVKSGQKWTKGEGGKKIAKNWWTSFMDGPPRTLIEIG